MGYLNVLFAVLDGQVQAIQTDSRRLLHPPAVISVGHVWWLSDEAGPLLELVGEVLDVGELLSPVFRHPLRSPIYHAPRRVRDLARRLDLAWQQPYSAEYRGEAGGMVRDQFERILGLFHLASTRGECIVSVLLPPTGVEGYDWVKMPFTVIPPRVVVEADNTPRLSRRSSPARSAWVVAGSWAGAGVLGVVGLCHWRYRRLTSRCSGPRPPSEVAGDS